jgi:hypothetical protein
MSDRYEAFRKQFKLFENPDEDDVNGIQSYNYDLDNDFFEIQFKDKYNDIYIKMVHYLEMKNWVYREHDNNDLRILFKRCKRNQKFEIEI